MNTPKIFKKEEILPILAKDAKAKNLKVFIYEGKDLAEYYELKYNNVAIALLAKNRDNAIWNLQNLRKCYMMWSEMNSEGIRKEAKALQ